MLQIHPLFTGFIGAAVKIALGISLLVNVALIAVLFVKETKEASRTPAIAPYCDALKNDLDFFIEGLTKGNDPFFTPISIRTMGSLLPSCFPGQAEKVNASLGELRQHLLYLVAANTSREQKQTAHGSALKLFRQLRALYGSQT